MQPWFELYPKRLEYELQALTDAGYTFTEDAQVKKAGKLVLRVQYPIEGELHTLTVFFPDLYPYFPFHIHGPTLPDGRHKNPYDGNLCLLKDPHTLWNTEDTLAAFLQEQVPTLVQLHQNPDHVNKDLEAQEATQLTGYFNYHPSSIVFTGDTLPPKDIDSGKLKFAVEPSVLKTGSEAIVLRGALLEIQGSNGEHLSRLEIEPPGYTGKLKGRWIRLKSPPKSTEPAEILQELVALRLSLKKPENRPIDVIGVLFEEETQREVYHENWIFLVRDTRNPDKNTLVTYLARADRLSKVNLQARAPGLYLLENKKVLVVGLGAIGSSCAAQLARAGVGKLHLLDQDFVQLGNLPRWLIGFNTVGHYKASILQAYIKNNYPWVEAVPFVHRLGAFSDNDVLPKILEGVDLILDATAEFCVSHFLSEAAKARKIPYVWATGTTGSQGGTVGRVVPGKTAGCWECFQRGMTEGSIPAPKADDSPYVQPVGCFHSTFTGTGFDMDNIALAAVRLTVSTLCEGELEAYPNISWDVGIASFWGEAGPIAPEWVTLLLQRHPDCKQHD